MVQAASSNNWLLLHCPGNRQQASLWLHERFAFDDQNGKEVFDACIEHLNLKGVPMVPGFSSLIAPGSWPLRDSSPPQIALPSAVLAYTTGDLRPWRSVWSRNQRADGLLESSDDTQNDERPAGWTAAQESALQAARQADGDTPRLATLDLESRWTNSVNEKLDQGVSVLVAKTARDRGLGEQPTADSVQELIESDIAWKQAQIGREERCMREIAVLKCMKADLLHEVIADLA